MSTDTLQAEYDNKGAAYFAYARNDLIDLLPPMSPGRVLEIGAGDGSTLVALKRRGMAREVVGVELSQAADVRVHDGAIDRFIVGNVENQDFDFAPASFDVLICGDVLEHLRDPWVAMGYLCGFLRPGGVALVSLPNILYWKALGRILTGDFRYCASGVLDRTHLRFFCRRNMVDLLKSAGLKVDTVEPSFRRQPELRRDKLLNLLSAGVVEPVFAQQYLLRAQKPVLVAEQ
jgi:2-polyprenyl-3-methyl-5-hydroxy-6-metoxy-1,4-benzoquinol methylase